MSDFLSLTPVAHLTTYELDLDDILTELIEGD